MSEVYGLIRKLGATSKYKGYYYVAEAVRMAQKIQERPVKITKDIYPIVARKYKSTPSNVEHNIRTLINLCWESHKDVLEEIAGCTMEDKPTFWRTTCTVQDILRIRLRISKCSVG